jgi:aconitate hydratase
MGVLPLQFADGQSAETLGLKGDESFTIEGIADIKPRQDMQVKVTRDDGTTVNFTARCRIDTYNELEYFHAGGILHYVLRKLAA